MRIGVLLEQVLAPVPGGIGRYSAELAAALARTAAGDDSVAGWTAWHRDPAAARIAGVEGPRRLVLPRRALAGAWQRGVGPVPRGADVIHAPSLLMPPATRGVPLVVTIHDAIPWTDPDMLTGRGARWHRRMGLRADRYAAAVCVPTHAVAERLQAALPGLKGRLHVVGAGVAPALLAEPPARQAADVRARLKLPDRFVLTVGTLEPRKGLDVLVCALAEVGAGAPQLIAVGQSGWGGVDLVSSARAAGLPEGSVRALGRVSDAELAVVLRAATSLVEPSRVEGFGLPVAEAMAVGTPVICSDAPALVEVAGPAALIFKRGDPAELATALDRVMRDDALRDRLATAGRERAVEFTWDAVARRAWRLYGGLTEGSHR